jgi:hypothetical protein
MSDTQFYFLGQLIGGYLHQDMDLEADSVPEAVSVFAEKADAASRAGVLADMADFLQQYHNRADEEFASRFGHDFLPGEIGQTLGEFFEMTAAIIENPSVYTRYLDESSAV